MVGIYYNFVFCEAETENLNTIPANFIIQRVTYKSCQKVNQVKKHTLPNKKTKMVAPVVFLVNKIK